MWIEVKHKIPIATDQIMVSEMCPKSKWLSTVNAYYFHGTPYNNKSAKGAYTWSSPVCLSMCEGNEYTNLSVTKEKYSKCNNFKAVGIG